jgi:hypothetical protein
LKKIERMNSARDAAKIQLLIAELRALNLSRSLISSRETEILDELDELNRDSGAVTPKSLTDSKRQSAGTKKTPANVTNGVLIGDRVYIKTKPQSWNKSREWDTQKAQFGTVTGTSSAKIDILTDYQTKTWRLPHNVTRIPK